MKSIDSDSKGVAEDFLERGLVPSFELGRVPPEPARIQRVKV